MAITELSTDKEYHFVCDAWLAVESETGEIDKRLHVANEKDLAAFHLVFASTASKGLLDGHIWFSIFTRPKYSTFTRVQRLSSCLLLIFLTMVTNAMFFGAGEGVAKIKVRIGKKHFHSLVSRFSYFLEYSLAGFLISNDKEILYGVFLVQMEENWFL